MQKEYDAAKQEAVTDYLTGIINRKAFMEKASELQAQAVKESAALSILFIDIDHFKQFNDTHGHLTGDEVLKFVAWTLKNLTRGKDVPARLGGEEFAVLLPETGLDGAMIVAEKIRSYFDTSGLKSRNDTRELGRISLSIGIALNRPDDTIDTLVDRADKAMYLAKKNGRNRVVSECEL
jgi:diguanylate cyclase